MNPTVKCPYCKEHEVELDDFSDDSHDGIEIIVYTGECNDCGTELTLTSKRETEEAA